MNRRCALLVMSGLLALLALGAGAAVLTDVVHYATGQPGTITVVDCAPDYGSRKPRYECTGIFRTRDGEQRRDTVVFAEPHDQPTGARLPATLNGGTVNEVSPAATATGALVAVASLVGVAVLLVMRRRLPTP